MYIHCMEKSKQTAVEYFLDQLITEGVLTLNNLPNYLLHYTQAKRMEREQIETAYERGLNFPWSLGCTVDDYPAEAKSYYKTNYDKFED
jgi:hypothetical protein